MEISQQNKELEYLDVFQEITRLISTVYDPQTLMDLVVRRLPELLEVDAASIRLLDRGSNIFVIGAAFGLSEEYLSRATIDTEEVMSQLMNGHPAARSDLSLKHDEQNCEYFKREGIKSSLSLPILHKDQVVGLIRLLTKEKRGFASHEISFAMSLAQQVGIGISNSRMYKEMQDQVEFLKELREISQLVNSTLDFDQIINAIVKKLPLVMNVKACTIRLLQPATNRLELVAASGLSKEYLERGSISREDSIFRVLGGEAVAVYDATKDPRVNYHREISKEGIKSLLAIPVCSGKEIIGVIRLLTDEHRLFSPSEIDFAMMVAEEGGNAIEKARTYRKIELLFNQIEEHERFLQTIMDSLWLQLVVIDPEKHVIMANKMFLETQGLEEHEVLGCSYYDVSPWAIPGNNDCPVAGVVGNKSSIAMIDQMELGGKQVWFERHLTPIINDNGDVDSVIEAVRDITDQKLLEQEKMERVKLEGIVELAGTVAHKINTPLFSALGTAQLLREDISSRPEGEELDLIIRNLEEISNLSRKMNHVTGFESHEYVGNTKIVKLRFER